MLEGIEVLRGVSGWCFFCMNGFCYFFFFCLCLVFVFLFFYMLLSFVF